MVQFLNPLDQFPGGGHRDPAGRQRAVGLKTAQLVPPQRAGDEHVANPLTRRIDAKRNARGDEDLGIPLTDRRLGRRLRGGLPLTTHRVDDAKSPTGSQVDVLNTFASFAALRPRHLKQITNGARLMLVEGEDHRSWRRRVHGKLVDDLGRRQGVQFVGDRDGCTRLRALKPNRPRRRPAALERRKTHPKRTALRQRGRVDLFNQAREGAIRAGGSIEAEKPLVNGADGDDPLLTEEFHQLVEMPASRVSQVQSSRRPSNCIGGEYLGHSRS